ncbi:2680_t:CDS:2 [Diversispora eburnea]|uniref:2680_t:CDS:1 n=1 Tax=Diversispora eburnea TaxID=1213867 RepID=A0A9N9A477_9GLOM|nr:2680_t:CDS:2 [Diversispora eburnea]
MRNAESYVDEQVVLIDTNNTINDVWLLTTTGQNLETTLLRIFIKYPDDSWCCC